MNRFRDERRRFVDNAIIEPFREPLFQFLHPRRNQVGCLQCIGPWRLKNAQADRRLAVEIAVGVKRPCSPLNATEQLSCGRIRPLFRDDVLQPHGFTIFTGADNDRSKLGSVPKPPLSAQRVLKSLSCGHGWSCQSSGGHLDILFTQGGDDVTGCELACGHFFRVEPDTHGIVLLAKHGNIADARNPHHFISQTNGRIVAQLQLIEGSIGREEIDHEQDSGRFFSHHDSCLTHDIGERREGEVDAVLHEHLSHIEINANVECHRQTVLAVVGGL